MLTGIMSAIAAVASSSYSVCYRSDGADDISIEGFIIFYNKNQIFF